MRTIILVFLVFLITAFPIHAQGTWEQITEINGQELGYVNKILNDGNGSMWVDAGNVFRFRDNTWETYTDTISGFNDFTVSANGDMWFSYYTSLVKYDGVSFQTFYPDTDSIHTSIGMNLIAVQSDGVVWVTNPGNGIIRFNGIDWHQYTMEDGLASHAIFNVTVSPDDELWLSYGTPIVIEYGNPCYGISNFDGETWRTYDMTIEGINSNRVMGIAFADNGDVFISYVYNYLGTAGGISKFNGEHWEWITDEFWGYSLTFDQKGNLWGYYESEPGIETNIGIYNGITSSIFPLPIRGGNPEFDDLGKCWFSTLEGILIFTPDNVSVKTDSPQPQVIQLFPNYPNPFNPATTIQYNLSENAQVRLSVYSITGQKIITLVDGLMRAGEHSVRFDGSLLPSGIYVVKLEANGLIKTNKILLVK